MFSKIVSLVLLSLVTINGECIPSYAGSGYCTKVNNNALCDYDGGDCCPSSCVDGTRECGSGGYNCQDPDEGGFDAFPNCQGNPSYFGTGYCTRSLNNAFCGYDGGDCCEYSCVSSDVNECGVSGPGFLCKDPTNGGSDPYPNCEKPHWIGTGYCTDVNNNEDCDYDGGDCCEESCVDGSRTCGSGGYDCKDPEFNLPGCDGGLITASFGTLVYCMDFSDSVWGNILTSSRSPSIEYEEGEYGFYAKGSALGTWDVSGELAENQILQLNSAIFSSTRVDHIDISCGCLGF